MSSVRLLRDGKRFDYDEEVEFNGRHSWEAFREMNGGGLPPLTPDEVNRILDTSMEEDNDSSTSEIEDKCADVYNDSKNLGGAHNSRDLNEEIHIEDSLQTEKKMVKPNSEEKEQAKELSEEYRSNHHKREINEESENESLQWLDKLRSDNKQGKLSSKNPLHKKIIWYLQLPSLEPVEETILKNLSEMKEKHDEWQNSNKDIFPPESKKIRKRKRVPEKVQRHLRSKLNNEPDFSNTVLKNESGRNDNPNLTAVRKEESMQKAEHLKVIDFSLVEDFEDVVTDDSCFPQTPKQREFLFRKFGMI